METFKAMPGSIPAPKYKKNIGSRMWQTEKILKKTTVFTFQKRF
jgi:hypothetical protein